MTNHILMVKGFVMLVMTCFRFSI